MTAPVRILGICGSLRQGSYNRLLLRAAGELLPPGATLEIAELRDIPAYDQDLESHPPAAVVALKARVRSADAILIATPEYNYGVPGTLKNAIDWVSRPYGDNSWNDKPVAAISASIGLLGGARAVYQLRQSFVFLNMHPINLPEVFVTFAPKKFDAEGHLTDADGRQILGRLLSTLVEWTHRIRPPAAPGAAATG